MLGVWRRRGQLPLAAADLHAVSSLSPRVPLPLPRPRRLRRRRRALQRRTPPPQTSMPEVGCGQLREEGVASGASQQVEARSWWVVGLGASGGPIQAAEEFEWASGES